MIDRLRVATTGVLVESLNPGVAGAVLRRARPAHASASRAAWVSEAAVKSKLSRYSGMGGPCVAFRAILRG